MLMASSSGLMPHGGSASIAPLSAEGGQGNSNEQHMPRGHVAHHAQNFPNTRDVGQQVREPLIKISCPEPPFHWRCGQTGERAFQGCPSLARPHLLPHSLLTYALSLSSPVPPSLHLCPLSVFISSPVSPSFHSAGHHSLPHLKPWPTHSPTPPARRA